MQKEAVSADVVFASTSSRFPSCKIGSNLQIADAKEDPKVLSMKEAVARETALLLEQQQRLSVRDLASKFEKGLAAAAKLSEEAKLREAASLEKHILLKKHRGALESLKGRVAGRNKNDVEEAIAMVEALAVQLTQREGELIQEKAEVKKLANFLKQASQDAKKLVDEERAFARAEIFSARAAVQRVEEALQEHEKMSRASGKQDLEELMEEVQEARRIIMLHQASKVMDMEHELRALRIQLAEKSKRSILLQKVMVLKPWVHICGLNLDPMLLRNFRNVQFSGIVFHLKVAKRRLYQVLANQFMLQSLLMLVEACRLRLFMMAS
ncbi:Stomatal closure-related actin-binding protein 1 [Hibiscus syriacus]|uniref:Stomatal closure-related actin-binding protein 1 n=1 Tax=Hibiscus syriacus TaxID=106335 RepID=A0A6A3CFW7_HIBSY|nr:Stomatal closure-related actin-binding protein 1 [Hibiscus syriacus]